MPASVARLLSALGFSSSSSLSPAPPGVLSWASRLPTLAFPVSWLMIMLGRECVRECVHVRVRMCVCISSLLFSLPDLIPPLPTPLFPPSHPCCNHFTLLLSTFEDKVTSVGLGAGGRWRSPHVLGRGPLLELPVTTSKDSGNCLEPSRPGGGEASSSPWKMDDSFRLTHSSCLDCLRV